MDRFTALVHIYNLHIYTSHKTHYCYTLTLLCITTRVLAAVTRGGGRQGLGPGGGGEKTDHYLIIPGYYGGAKLPHRHTHSLYYSFPFFMSQLEKNVYP